MKIAIITPFLINSNRGNAISTKRLSEGLKKSGIDVRVVVCNSEDMSKVYEEVNNFKPDIIHAIHAYKSGECVLKINKKNVVPFIVSLRGTDINIDIADSSRRKTIIDVLKLSSKIIVLTPSMKNQITFELPDVGDKVVVIPHSVKVDKVIYDFSNEVKIKRDDLVFLLPSNIRRIKEVLSPLKYLEKLKRKYNEIKLIFAGPILEDDYGREFLSAIKNHSWVHYIGEIPHEKMYALMNLSDVVINSSIEEGLSNAVLEAMSIGKAVLVSKNRGNMELVSDGVDGYLFGGEEEFIDKAEKLIKSEELRNRLGDNAEKKIITNYSPEAEIEKHISVYREILSKPR